MKKFCILIFLFFNANVLGEIGPAGEAYFKNSPDKAVNLYEAEIKKTPSEEAYLNKAYVQKETAKLKPALATLTQALKDFPKSTNIKRSLADIHLALGNHAQAQKLLTEILNSKAGRHSDYVTLGIAYFMQGSLTNAKKYFTKALDAPDKVSIASYFLGLISLQESDINNAEKEFKKVLNTDSQFLEARARIAEIYEAKSMNDNAWTEYHKLSLAEPENKYLKAKDQQFAKLLSKPQDEIIVPYKIAKHSRLSATIEGYPDIRLGLSTTIGGAPVAIKEIVVSPSSAFAIKGKDSGDVYASGKAATEWTITLNDDKKSLTIKSPGGASISVEDEDIIFEQTKRPYSIILKRLLVAQGTSWASISDREYRGTLEILIGDRGLTLVNVINIEAYVQGVLSAEMPAKYPMEALKAQAVLARSYTMFNLKRHKKFGYDLCDGQHCQVYTGVIAETPRTSKATNETKGLILTYKNKPVNAVFSSNSGGFTQDGKNSWGNTNPYWEIVSDYLHYKEIPEHPYIFDKLFKTMPQAYSQKSEYVGLSQYRWSRAVKASDMAREISYVKDIGEIKSVIPKRRDRSGHIGGVTVTGTKGTVNFDKEFQVRKYLGMGLLRSGAFVVDTIADAKGNPAYFIFYGGGWGHGVGFCQSGSSGHATAGAKYTDILKHYYPNTTFKDLTQDNPAK